MSNIIFDFDGTIADSFAVVVRIIHQLTNQDTSLPVDEIERLRGMALLQAAREVHVHFWKIPFLLMRGRRQMRSHMGDIRAFPDIPETIHQLYKDGHKLFIMSSNSMQNIELFLDGHKLCPEFIKLYGSVGLLGKAPVLRKIMKQNKLDPADTFYVGDEVRDVDAAKHAGIRVIAVTWGYNTAEVIDRHEPDYLVDTPSQVLEIFQGFQPK